MPIYFVRHGQSEFNAVHNEGENDPLIFDAPLTDEGRRQAEEAKVLVIFRAGTAGGRDAMAAP